MVNGSSRIGSCYQAVLPCRSLCPVEDDVASRSESDLPREWLVGQKPHEGSVLCPVLEGPVCQLGSRWDGLGDVKGYLIVVVRAVNALVVDLHDRILTADCLGHQDGVG